MLLSQKTDFVSKLNSRKFKLVKADTFEYGVMIMIGAMTGKSFEKKCETIIPAILEILEEIKAPKKDRCPISGVEIYEDNSKLTIIPETKMKVRLSNNAIDTVNATIDNYNEEFDKSPNNYLKGFFGILIGAVVGAILTFLFGLVGFITAASPFVAILLCVFLYEKFGGKKNYFMIILSFITTLVVISGMIVLVYILAANKLLDGSLKANYKGFEALKYCINNNAEFKRSFTLDIVLNIVFILIAEGISLFRLLKEIKKPQKIE